MGVNGFNEFLNDIEADLIKRHMAQDGDIQSSHETLADALEDVARRTDKRLKVVYVDIGSFFFDDLIKLAAQTRASIRPLASQGVTFDTELKRVWQKFITDTMYAILDTLRSAGCDEVQLVPVIDHPTQRPEAKQDESTARMVDRSASARRPNPPRWSQNELDLVKAGKVFATVRQAKDEGDTEISDLLLADQQTRLDLVLSGDSDLPASVTSYGYNIRKDKSKKGQTTPYKLYNKFAFEQSPHFPFPPRDGLSASERLRLASALAGNDYTICRLDDEPVVKRPPRGLPHFGLKRLAEQGREWMTSSSPAQLKERLERDSQLESLPYNWTEVEWRRVKHLICDVLDDGQTRLERALDAYTGQARQTFDKSDLVVMDIDRELDTEPNLEWSERVPRDKDRRPTGLDTYAGLNVHRFDDTTPYDPKDAPQFVQKLAQTAGPELQATLDRKHQLALSRRLMGGVSAFKEVRDGQMIPSARLSELQQPYKDQTDEMKQLADFPEQEAPSERQIADAQAYVHRHETLKKESATTGRVKADSVKKQRAQNARDASERIEAKSAKKQHGHTATKREPGAITGATGARRGGIEQDSQDGEEVTSDNDTEGGDGGSKDGQEEGTTNDGTDGDGSGSKDGHEGEAGASAGNEPGKVAQPKKLAATQCWPRSTVRIPLRQVVRNYTDIPDPRKTQRDPQTALEALFRLVAHLLKRGPLKTIADSFTLLCDKLAPDASEWSAFATSKNLKGHLRDLRVALTGPVVHNANATVYQQVAQEMLSTRKALPNFGSGDREIWEPMLEQIATSISTTATKTASDSIMTYIQKIAVGEMIEPQVDISSHDDDTQRLLRHKTTTTLFVILLDVEFGKVKGRKQEDRLMLLADVATETSAIDAVSKKQLQSLEEYLDTIKKPRMSQASKTAWVHATRNEASRLLGLRRERVQLSKTRTTLRSILKSETARAISLVHFVKRQLHERDQSKQCGIGIQYRPKFVHFSSESTWWIIANSTRVTRVATKWLSAAQTPHLDSLGRLQAEVDRLRERLDRKSQTGRDAAAGRILALMHHIFDCSKLPNGRIFAGSWSTNGLAVHFSLYKITKALPKAHAAYPTATTPLELFDYVVDNAKPVIYRRAAMQSVEQALKTEISDHIASFRQLVRQTAKFETSTETRNGLPVWAGGLASPEMRARFVKFLQSSPEDPTWKKADAIQEAGDSKSFVEDVERMSKDKLKSLLDETIEINVDVGFTYVIAAEVKTFSVNGEPIVRYPKLRGSSLQENLNNSNRTTSVRGHKTPADDWKRSRRFQSEQDRVVAELCELAGVTSFGAKGKNGHVPTVQESHLTFRHLTGTRKRHVVLNVGDDCTSPGKKRGIHNAAFGMPIIRRLLQHLVDTNVSVWLNRVDEYATSKVCPVPTCLRHEDACRSILKEPQFSPKRKYPCHRVQECQGCLRRYNRDIAAAINIGYVSFHRLLHAGVHPFRGETEGSLVKRLRSRLELL